MQEGRAGKGRQGQERTGSGQIWVMAEHGCVKQGVKAGSGQGRPGLCPAGQAIAGAA